MKKTLALALAVMMLCVCAFTVSAAETTIEDIDTGAWWTTFANGIPVTEEGFTLTLDSTAYADAAVFYACPSVIIYSSDNAAIWGPNYVEYWIHRGDNWGWCSAGGNSPYGDLDSGDGNVANVAAAGITIDRVFAEGFKWENWLAELKAGVACTITGKLEGSNAIISLTVGKVTNTLTLPVDTSKTLYVCLTGEQAVFTNIKVTTPDPEPVPCEHTNTEVKDAKEATCTEAGYTGDTYCADCGEKTATGTAIAVIDHAYAEGKCTVCGAEDPNYVAPCQHTNTKVEGAVDATCEKAGFSGNTVCADCGEKLADGEEIAATGHDYVDGKCTACGNPETGDVFGIMVALMAASGTALVCLKKKEN